MLESLTTSASELLRGYQVNRYPHSALWINGRSVSIDKIMHEREPIFSPFEKGVFTFIREWLSGTEQFQMNTSGSTGEPKIISISRLQMMASAVRTSEKIKLQKDSSALICIDIKYIGGMMMLARCLTLGLRMMAVDPTANPLIKIPVDKCVQFTAFVPYQVTSILESKHPHLLNSLDKVLIGGAPLNRSGVGELDRFQSEFYETYGMTETVSHIALRLVNTEMKRQYFETLPGVQISHDDRGCLVVSADYLPNPVITNDLVEMVGAGKFLWLGRWDNVINTGGVKVMPEKVEEAVEAVFKANKISHRFLIAGLPDEKLGNKVVLILEGVQISSELLSNSLAALRSALSPFEFPKEVYGVHEFAFTDTQKIDRNKTLAGASLLSTLK